MFQLCVIVGGKLKVLNVSGTTINPATEDTLDAIKDIDGIKKIVDALPTGDNWLGKFKLGDGTNIVAVVDDSGTYRLATLSKVYNASGSIINPATEDTLDSIKDTDGIKKITDALPTGDNWLGKLKVGDGTNIVAVVDDSGTYRLATISKLYNASGTIVNPATEDTLDSIKDTDGIKKITDALPTGDNWIGRVKFGDGTTVADVITDSTDDINRVAVVGKVSITDPEPPAATTAVLIPAYDPLEISATDDTEYVIPDGKRLTIQTVYVTAEGDPTVKGSGVNIVYDMNGTEELVTMIHIMGQPYSQYPNTAVTFDGTYLDGNTAGTNKVIVRRLRFSNNSLEVVGVVRGYLTDTP
jgi:hypothetical protein